MREEGEKEDPVNGGGEWVLKTGNQNEKDRLCRGKKGTSQLQAFSSCGGVVPNKIMGKLDEALQFNWDFPRFYILVKRDA